MRDWALSSTTAASPAARAEGPFTVSPFTERCAGILDRHRHMVIGVSPGSGFFSQERLTALLHWANERFARVDVVTAHVEMAACTYLGRGYEPKHARARAYRDVRQMTNRITRAVKGSGVDVSRCRVLYISDGFEAPAYREAREEITRAKREFPAFHDICTRMVADALRGDRMPPGWQPDADQITEGMEYLEMELPYLMNSPGILGAAESVFAYRAVPALTPFLYLTGAPLPAARGQGFVKLEPRG